AGFGVLDRGVLLAPRGFQAMAAAGVCVEPLARLHPRYRTPAGAIGLMGRWSIVVALSGTYAQLLDYVVFGDWIFFGLTVASLFVYRARDRAPFPGPHPPSPSPPFGPHPLSPSPRGGEGERTAGIGFRVPAYPWTPALFVLAAAYVVVSSIVANPRNALIGTGLLALGVPVYRVARRNQVLAR